MHRCRGRRDAASGAVDGGRCRGTCRRRAARWSGRRRWRGCRRLQYRCCRCGRGRGCRASCGRTRGGCGRGRRNGRGWVRNRCCGRRWCTVGGVRRGGRRRDCRRSARCRLRGRGGVRMRRRLIRPEGELAREARHRRENSETRLDEGPHRRRVERRQRREGGAVGLFAQPAAQRLDDLRHRERMHHRHLAAEDHTTFVRGPDARDRHAVKQRRPADAVAFGIARGARIQVQRPALVLGEERCQRALDQRDGDAFVMVVDPASQASVRLGGVSRLRNRDVHALRLSPNLCRDGGGWGTDEHGAKREGHRLSLVAFL